MEFEICLLFDFLDLLFYEFREKPVKLSMVLEIKILIEEIDI